MGQLHLYTIGIEKLRSFFGAAGEEVARLRRIAEETFPAPDPPPTRMIDKLGPMMRRAANEPVIRPDVPTRIELDALVTGSFVPPTRLVAAWALVLAWLDDYAEHTVTVECSTDELRDADFNLALAGLPSQYTLSACFTHELQIPLGTPLGWHTGWQKGSTMCEGAKHWATTSKEISDQHKELLADVIDWFANWSADEQDLLAVYQP